MQDAVSEGGLISLLKECRHRKNLEQAKRLYASMQQHHLDSHPLLANYLVPTLVDCGSLADAHYVFFACLPPAHRAEHSWTSLITSYSNGENPRHVFHLYHLMQEEKCARPSKHTYIALLNACTRLTDSPTGQEVHHEIAKWGLDKDLRLGSTLVDMYGKCGLHAEARHIFDHLPCRDTVSWTTLIGGYAELGANEEVLNYCRQMQLHGVPADAVTYLCCLKACGATGDIIIGREIHAETTKKGFEIALFIGSTLVDMYMKCGSLAEGVKLFDSLPVRSVVSWNVLLTGYAEQGFDEELMNCFQKMQQEVSASTVTCVSMLKACGALRALEAGQKMHAETVKKAYERELITSGALVDMYGKCGSLAEAQHVFDTLPTPNAVSWTGLLNGYAECGLNENGVNCVKQMLHEAVPADALTFVCILRVCVAAGALEISQDLHIEICKRGFERELFLGNSLVDMYVKCNLLPEARQVLDGLPVRDAVSWNVMIGGYIEHGLHEEAANCFQQMQLECVCATAVTIYYNLKACGTIRALEKGQQIHADLIKYGWDGGIDVSSALVDMYGRCGLLVDARLVFDSLLVQNTTAWNALVAGYADSGSAEEVMICFRQMLSDGVSMDSTTFICCLKSISTIGALEVGRELHSEIWKAGLERNLFVANLLVDMYSRCGWVAEGQAVFDRMPVRDIVSWNAILTGYAERPHGGETVRSCLQQILLEGISPDSLTLVCCLKACSLSKSVEVGHEIHAEVLKRALEKDFCVGGALVDMYGKCSSFAESCHVFEELPVEDAIAKNALIMGYSECGLTEETFDSLYQMHMENVSVDAVTYVCSLKACGTVGDLETCQTVHIEATKRGVERELFVGSTLVDVYSKCNLLVEAHNVFHRLPARSVVSWNVLIAGYAERGLVDEVMNCFKQMQSGGVPVGAATIVHCLNVCGTTGALDIGRRLHTEAGKLGIDSHNLVGIALIDMYGKCASVLEAHKVFDKLHVKDVASWTALLKAYGENHEGSMAIQCFEAMQKHGVRPDSMTFTCLLSACSHASLVVKGQEYFKLMKGRENIVPTMDHFTCMVDLFARSGCVDEAERFLAGMQYQPSKDTLMNLLSACTSYGKVDTGQRCFQQLVEMNEEDASAYLLMASLYIEAGRWHDAVRVEEIRKSTGAKKRHSECF